MKDVTKEKQIHGVSISDGIALGFIHYFLASEEPPVREYKIPKKEITKEIERYKRALQESQKELILLKSYLEKEEAREAALIIDAQVIMLEDPFLTEDVERMIFKELKNVESVLSSVMKNYSKVFEEMCDSEMQQRLHDVKDLYHRILKHLAQEESEGEEGFPMKSLLTSFELSPSHTAEASFHHVEAFITEMGGSTSHTAIIAKARGIPYVSRIPMSMIEKYQGRPALIDGTKGLVIVNPSKETLSRYQKNSKKEGERRVHNDEIIDKCVTLDGVEIDVQANLESLHDITLLKQYKVKAIGLVRSEFLYLQKELEKFNEEEQFQLYRKLMQLASGMEVIFRVFDVGSDKKLMRHPLKEPNPALGCRSIRFLLKYPHIFRSQLRAVLRASQYGKLKLLLPLIADVSELKEAKDIIHSVMTELQKEGYDRIKPVEIGCMVEVPAFVIMCHEMIKECHFLSIGTNDLIQYTLALDRADPETSEKYGSLHPSVEWMIQHVFEVAAKKNVPVNICGDIASDAKYTETLIRLGARRLSCVPRYIPQIKKVIRSINLSSLEL